MYYDYVHLHPTIRIASWGPGYSVYLPRSALPRDGGPYLHGMVRVKGRHFFPSETWCGDSDSLQSFGKWSFPKAGQKLQSLIPILPFVRRSWTANKTPDLWTFDCLGSTPVSFAAYNFATASPSWPSWPFLTSNLDSTNCRDRFFRKSRNQNKRFRTCPRIFKFHTVTCSSTKLARLCGCDNFLVSQLNQLIARPMTLELYIHDVEYIQLP